MAAQVDIAYRESTPTYDPKRRPFTFKKIAIEKGDIEAGFAAADVIVEGEYRMGHQRDSSTSKPTA